MRVFSALILIIILGGGLYWFFGSSKNSETFLSDKEEGVTSSNEVSQVLTSGTVTNVGGGQKRYLHEERGFSFLFGGDLAVTALPDLDGEILLLREQGTDTREFQIYATYFDEEGPITVSRIKEDVPDLKIENPQQVLIGAGKTVDALIFTGESEDFGRTREVWFVGGGQLFQVITPEGNDDFIGPILDTWEFVG